MSGAGGAGAVDSGRAGAGRGAGRRGAELGVPGLRGSRLSRGWAVPLPSGAVCRARLRASRPTGPEQPRGSAPSRARLGRPVRLRCCRGRRWALPPWRPFRRAPPGRVAHLPRAACGERSVLGGEEGEEEEEEGALPPVGRPAAR